MTSAARTPIVRFIRGTLGCRCPDDVLRSIAVETDCRDGSCRFTRVSAGNRLLVYVVAVTGDCDVATVVGAVTRRGREDRDSHGFNRFRLVLASDDATLSATVAPEFAAVAGNDDRTHLHVVSPRDLPDLSTHESADPTP